MKKSWLVSAFMPLVVMVCGIGVITPTHAFSKSPLPDMVLVKDGVFMQGTNEEDAAHSQQATPLHQVKINAFYLSSHEITVEQFAYFVQKTDYVTDAERNMMVGQNEAKGCFVRSIAKQNDAGGAEHHGKIPDLNNSRHTLLFVSAGMTPRHMLAG